MISHKMKVGFIKDSELYNKVKNMKKGKFLHIVGIPRIDLNLVAWRVAHAGTHPEALDWNLPFEMIAVGEIK